MTHKKSGSEPTKCPAQPQVKIKTMDQLKTWLAARDIDASQWGRGAAKTIEGLWEEIANGEISIHDDPPLRVVPVACVIIRKGDDILIELEQEFGDKRVRRRNQPPSEKMKEDEHYTDAAVRCLQEELGLRPSHFEIIPSTYHQVEKEQDSPSYPGLHTRYTFHIVEAKVKGLPDRDFWTDESAENENDMVRRHHWVWRTQPDEAS
jgi:ADP-ribose pyrophosphatase YjhB (NUDIX family)